MQNTYVVYLNKTYDVWARDAHEWAEKNNLPTDHIISEVAFWVLMDQGVLDGAPVYFCKHIQDDRKAFVGYFKEEYPEDSWYELQHEQEERERMMQSEDMYSSLWESNDPNAPDYEDTQDVEWPTHSSNPEYIIASILHKAEETYVFEANENGEITSYAEYGGLAKRWGDELWSDYDGAVEKVFGKGKYELLRRVSTDDNKAAHILYKRINEASTC